MELQSGQVRVVLGRSEWNAEADVHDAIKRAPAGKTGDD